MVCMKTQCQFLMSQLTSKQKDQLNEQVNQQNQINNDYRQEVAKQHNHQLDLQNRAIAAQNAINAAQKNSAASPSRSSETSSTTLFPSPTSTAKTATSRFTQEDRIFRETSLLPSMDVLAPKPTAKATIKSQRIDFVQQPPLAALFQAPTPLFSEIHVTQKLIPSSAATPTDSTYIQSKKLFGGSSVPILAILIGTGVSMAILLLVALFHFRKKWLSCSKNLDSLTTSSYSSPVYTFFDYEDLYASTVADSTAYAPTVLLENRSTIFEDEFEHE